MAAGSIVIDLLLRSGSFETDTARAARVARKAVGEIDSAFSVLQGRLGSFATGLASAFSVGVLINFTRKTIDSIDALNDFADATGTSIENASALGDVAQRTGTDLATAESILVKFNQTLKDADGKNGPSQALKNLGLEVEAIKRLDPAQALLQTAKALSTFATDGEKARYIQELFGKSVKDAAPFLKDLAEKGELNATVTKQQAEEAEKFNKQIFALQTNVADAARAIALQLIPQLNNLFALASGSNGSLLDGIFGTSLQSKLTSQADAINAQVNRTVESIERMQGELNRVQSRGGSDSVLETRITKARDRLKELQTQAGRTANQLKDLADLNEPRTAKAEEKDKPKIAPPPPTPTPPKSAGAVLKDDPTKKLLDNDLKAIENLVRREQDLLSDRNKFLNLYNDQGLLSISSYYDAQLAILEAATTATVRHYDQQISDLRAFQAKKATSEKDRADAQGKINDILEKQRRLEQDTGQKGLELDIRRQEAQRQLAREIGNVNTQLLEMQGKFREAAAARFDDQNRTLRLKLVIEGDKEALAKLDKLREGAILQAEFAQESQRAGNVLGNLGAAIDEIALKQQTGAIGELEALRQIGVARQASIRDLEGIVAAQEAVAKASGNDALILQARRARIELEQLKAVADPLAQKFTELFEDSFANNFASFLDGTKSAKAAFKDFAASIFGEINRIVAKDFAKSLFSKDGVFGGVGGALGGLFGGKPDAPGFAGVTGIAGPLGNVASAFKAPPVLLDTAPATASLTTLATVGADPATIALQALAQAAESSRLALSKPSTGEDSFSLDGVFGSAPVQGDLFGGDLFSQPAQEGATLARTLVDTRTSAQAFGDILGPAAQAVAGMGQAGTAAAFALQLLPAIIQAFGGSSGIGAAASSLFSVFGFAAGGYTGPGGKYQVVGPAHAGEVIFSQEDVARWGGPANVEALRLNRGFADGGIVARTAGLPPPSAVAPSSRNRAGDSITIPVSVVGGGPLTRRNEEAIEAAAMRGYLRAKTRGTAPA